MASKIRRRSGNAVTQFLEKIEYVPDMVVMAGVGINSEETSVMREVWGDKFDLVGYEPNHVSYRSLAKNFPGLLKNRAVSNFHGTAKLYFPPKHKDATTLFQRNEDNKKPVKTQDTQVVCLDDEFREECPCTSTLLWLDCEGSELQALQGGIRFVKKCVDVVNVEMTGNPRCDGWSSHFEVDRWLRNEGFIPSWIHTTRIAIGQFDCIYVKRKLARKEFCCVPGLYDV